MKIFKLLQRHYAFFGIAPSNQLAQKLPVNERILLGFLVFGCLLLLQFLHIFYVANGFMELMESICATSGAVIIFVCFTAVVIRKTTLFEVIENIEKLLDTRCKYPKSRRFFLKTRRQVERLSDVVFKAVIKIAVQFLMLPKCLVSYGVYFMTDSGSDSFELPVPMWFPFEWDNPIGYLYAVIFQYILIGYEFFVVACTLSLGMGIFWFAISSTKEIKRILHSINNKAHANQSNELKILFFEYIDTHGNAKQVVQDFSAIFQPIFMALFTWSLLAICAALLIVQVQMSQHGDVSALLVTVFDASFALVTVFISCELGQRINEAFDGINLKMDHLDWYLFPIEIKRMLPMIIAIAQESVSFECFGSITCTRDVFEKIVKTAFSYFMTFRQLDN